MMKRFLSPVIPIFLGLWCLFLVASCNRSSGPAGDTPDAKPAKAVADRAVPLPPEQVCMVNNAFMGEKQILVAFGGKTYYGCCEMCVEKIQTQREARFAKDPLSGKEVDKAEAFIVPAAPGQKQVLYFESEASYRQFLRKQG